MSREVIAALVFLVIGSVLGSDDLRTAKLISNGTSETTGLLQAWTDANKTDANGTWSYVDARTWDMEDAIVACRDLGFKGLDTYFSSRMDVLSTTVITLLECNGTETQLSNCSHTVDNDTSQHYSIVVAAVSCTVFPSVRLTGMGSPDQGRVEVFLNGKWGGVCDDYWDQREGEVICRQLGFIGFLAMPGRIDLSSNSIEIIMDDMNCTETDTDIRLCSKRKIFTSNCQPSELAGVICIPNSCPELPGINNGKITNDRAITEVEFMCDEGYSPVNERSLVCDNGHWNGTMPMCVPAMHGEGKSGDNSANDVSNQRKNLKPRRIILFGILAAGIFLLFAFVVIIMLVCASKHRARKRIAAEVETLDNLSAPLVIDSDGKELGEAHSLYT